MWRSTKSATGFTRIATTAELDYFDTTAKRYTAYYYKIRAVAGSSASAFSATNSRWHDVGPAVTFTTDDKGYTTVSWNAKTKVAGYYLFRATAGSSSFTRIATTSASVTSYKDTVPANGTQYTYYVAAYYRT